MAAMGVLKALRALALTTSLAGLCACGGATGTSATQLLPATSAQRVDRQQSAQEPDGHRGHDKHPLVLPAGGYGGDPSDGNTDPGATADQHLFGVILDNNENTSDDLKSNCPGGKPSVANPSGCNPYKYTDLLLNYCNTQIESTAYSWASSSDESAMLHVWNGTISASNRLPGAIGPGNCQNGNSVYFNPSDSAFNSYLSTNVWNGSDDQKDFPAPYGVMEDDSGIEGSIRVGGYGSISTEFACGEAPNDGFATKRGCGTFAKGWDYERAIGSFVNKACVGRCLNMMLNGIAPGASTLDGCSVIANGHCHGPYFAGEIDDQIAINPICRIVRHGNLKYLIAERPIFIDRNGYQYSDSLTMTAEINTIANLYSKTSGGCAHTKVLDFEPGWGLGGPGDVNGGTAVRTTTLAFRWLVPNPATGMPDRVLPFIYTVGGTTGEVPYYFEETLVPAGAEHPVSRFNWNGTTQTIGGGCPSSSGDTGGAISLRVACAGSSGIYCQQYRHLFVNGLDYGKAAACLNTSTTSENVTASWFTGDPIGSYRYRLALQGGEMTSVRYKNAYGGAIPLTTCTNSTYCTGANTLSAQVAAFKGDGSDTLCGPCGAIFLQKS